MIVIKTRQPDPELEQKIRMLLEREHIEAEQISIDSWEKLVLPGLTLDGMTHEVSCNGRKVSLTRLEFDLLLMLASHEGQIFSKEELFRAVWGQNCDDTLKVVANTVSNLRKKLAGCGSFYPHYPRRLCFCKPKGERPGMTRILFICLGNICRSPMAEYVMKDLTSKAGLSEQFEIASAATSAWEIGNPVYPPARQKLAEHGIDCNGKTARQMTRLDYARYDHLIGMDESNLCDILRLVGGDPQHKVSLLMAHTDHPREVADPWFTGDFEATWQDILEGCTALLEELR